MACYQVDTADEFSALYKSNPIYDRGGLAPFVVTELCQCSKDGVVIYWLDQSVWSEEDEEYNYISRVGTDEFESSQTNPLVCMGRQ